MQNLYCRDEKSYVYVELFVYKFCSAEFSVSALLFLYLTLPDLSSRFYTAAAHLTGPPLRSIALSRCSIVNPQPPILHQAA